MTNLLQNLLVGFRTLKRFYHCIPGQEMKLTEQYLILLLNDTTVNRANLAIIRLSLAPAVI
jgi:hypothetical protein